MIKKKKVHIFYQSPYKGLGPGGARCQRKKNPLHHTTKKITEVTCPACLFLIARVTKK